MTQKVNFFYLCCPPPPPPENPDFVKNYYLRLNAPGNITIGMPFRNAPILRGNVWKDENGNGQKDKLDAGFSAVKLFLDQNGNFQLDQNETAFEPKEGRFICPPSSSRPIFSVCTTPKPGCKCHISH